MATVVAYCVEGDLHLGSVPPPSGSQKTIAKWIQEGAEEIDSKIGFRYATPVVAGDSALNRPTKLLLKKINAWLSSGRFIMAAATQGSDDQLQQQGLYLVTQALLALEQIADGTVVLPGIALVDDSEPKNTGPVGSWADPYSIVEEHAGVFGYPNREVIERRRFEGGTELQWWQRHY